MFKAIIILLGAMFLIGESKAEELKLLITEQEDFVSLSVLNNGLDILTVNKRMSLGRLGELELTFKNKDGKLINNLCKINSFLPEQDDFSDLFPNHIVGYAVSKERLISCFNLNPGKYILTAKYTGYKGKKSDVKSFLSNFESPEFVFLGDLKATALITID